MPLTRSEVRLRRQARARTLQALYAWEAAGSQSLGDAAMRLWDDLALPAEVREVAGPMLRAVEAHRAEIDEAIVAAADNWRMERIGAIERAVLRLATCEADRRLLRRRSRVPVRSRSHRRLHRRQHRPSCP